MNAQKGGIAYHLEYAPVGNQPTEPIVILCGKTPDSETAETFRGLLKDKSIEEAGFRSVYSNPQMRLNLYNYLLHIGLFAWLGSFHPYWQQRESTDQLWKGIFSDLQSSRECGIQMTQATNCAILRDTNSSEPTKKAFDEVNTACPKCFFRSSTVTHNLRLVVFFDTPFDGRFHQVDYWPTSDNGKKAAGARVISITHPSTQNNEVHKHLPKIIEMSRQPGAKTRVVRAARLLEQAMKTVAELNRPENSNG